MCWRAERPRADSAYGCLGIIGSKSPRIDWPNRPLVHRVADNRWGDPIPPAPLPGGAHVHDPFQTPWNGRNSTQSSSSRRPDATRRRWMCRRCQQPGGAVPILGHQYQPLTAVSQLLERLPGLTRLAGCWPHSYSVTPRKHFLCPLNRHSGRLPGRTRIYLTFLKDLSSVETNRTWLSRKSSCSSDHQRTRLCELRTPYDIKVVRLRAQLPALATRCRARVKSSPQSIEAKRTRTVIPAIREASFRGDSPGLRSLPFGRSAAFGRCWCPARGSECTRFQTLQREFPRATGLLRAGGQSIAPEGPPLVAIV
jgi:hypothetical protein